MGNRLNRKEIALVALLLTGFIGGSANAGVNKVPLWNDAISSNFDLKMSSSLSSPKQKMVASNDWKTGAGTGVVTGILMGDAEAALKGGVGGAACEKVLGKGKGSKLAGVLCGVGGAAITHGYNIQEKQVKEAKKQFDSIDDKRIKAIYEEERRYQIDRKIKLSRGENVPEHSTAFYNHQAMIDHYNYYKVANVLFIKTSGKAIPAEVKSKFEGSVNNYLSLYDTSKKAWKSYFSGMYKYANADLSSMTIAMSAEEQKTNKKLLSGLNEAKEKKNNLNYFEAIQFSKDEKILRDVISSNIEAGFIKQDFDPSKLDYTLRSKLLYAFTHNAQQEAAKEVEIEARRYEAIKDKVRVEFEDSSEKTSIF